MLQLPCVAFRCPQHQHPTDWNSDYFQSSSQLKAWESSRTWPSCWAGLPTQKTHTKLLVLGAGPAQPHLLQPSGT